MGLDITAHEKLTKVDGVKYIGGEVYNTALEVVDDYAFVAHKNGDFPGMADDIEDGCVYNAADGFSFRAGSYGGYNAWRNELARIAGYPKGFYSQFGQDRPTYCASCWAGVQGPFSELINFSDCEGVIGTAVSQKLAADFEAFDAVAQTVSDFDFYRRYQDFRKAFTMAANGGAVQFC